LLNVGNMINDSWGTYWYSPLASYENIRPLRVVSAGSSTAAPTFRLNAETLESWEDLSKLSRTLTTSSTWGCLLGVRLIF